MSHPTVLDLIKRIPPPREPDSFQGKALNASFGPAVELPDDYVEFMRIYGPGWITEAGNPSIGILDLAGVSDAEMIQQELEIAAEDHRYDGTTYPPAFPSMPGLLPWGNWDQGGILYWWTTGAANEWTIAFKQRSEFEWYECTFSEYLLHNMVAWQGVSERERGQGLGTRLLALALRDCFEAGRTFPFVAVVLDCLNDAAKQFFLKFDFHEIPGNPYRLFLSSARLEAMMKAP